MDERIRNIVALGMFNVSIESGEIMESDIKKIGKTLTTIKQTILKEMALRSGDIYEP